MPLFWEPPEAATKRTPIQLVTPHTMLVARAVVEKNLSRPAYRIYLYLCSLNIGQPIPQSIDDIGKATHLARRTVIDAIAELVKARLIAKNRPSRTGSNLYRVVLDPPRRRPNSPAERIDPKLLALEQLATLAYRELAPAEMQELRHRFGGADALRALEELIHYGGVAREMSYGFFAGKLEDIAKRR